MDSVHGYYAQFRQQAFIWRAAFSKRRTERYVSENTRHVLERLYISSQQTGGENSIDNISTEDVVQRFVNNKCHHDIDRYFYRTDRLASFLEAADMEGLRGPATPQVSRIKALIDDRNNATVTRDIASFGGARRTSQGPHDARGLYSELLRPVRYLVALAFDLTIFFNSLLTYNSALIY